MKPLRILALTLLCCACLPQGKISNRNVAYLYSYPAPEYTPGLSLFHFSTDSTSLLVRISPSALGQTREEGNATASFTVAGLLFNDYAAPMPLDSFRHTFSITGDEFDRPAADREIRFKTTQPSSLVIDVRVTDHNSAYRYATLLELARRHTNDPQNFKVTDAGSPLVHEFLTSETVFITHNSRRNNLNVRYVATDRKPAWPPHILQPSVHPRVIEDSSFAILSTAAAEFPREGIYIITTNAPDGKGLMLMKFHPDYPRITTPGLLVETLRYITKNEEYGKMTSAADKKMEVDEFWLKRAGSFERAKALIREYYTRVEFANLHFASFKEGWKTDRGMIYIIYGPPDNIYLDGGSESWIYDATINEPVQRFDFTREEHPFSARNYVLARHPALENGWNIAVHRWRSGRVSEVTR